MAFYASPRLYIQSGTDLADKICKIEAIIAALIDAQIAAVDGQTTEEYALDDGQTKIRSVYRSPEEIAQAINRYEQILQRYANRYNGRTIRLVDVNAHRHSH